MTQAELEHAAELLAPDVLLIREVKRPTVETTTAISNRALRLVEGQPAIDLIVDLDNAGRPSAEVREVIHQKLGDMPLRRVVVVAKNPLLRIATRFILNGLPINRLDAPDVPRAFDLLQAR